MPESSMTECLFCRIVAGDIPAAVVHETDTVLAFKDVSPVAPVHTLVIPKSHWATLAEMAAGDPELAADLVAAVRTTAEIEGVSGGYRMVVNTGAEAGQTVHHVHAHVIGGRQMQWPPG